MSLSIIGMNRAQEAYFERKGLYKVTLLGRVDVSHRQPQ